MKRLGLRLEPIIAKHYPSLLDIIPIILLTAGLIELESTFNEVKRAYHILK